MILSYDPATSLRHWPMPMSRFGTNPYGDNLYRIVFAPSRRHLVCGEWPDGSNQAQYVKKYPAVGEQWIMERWLRAEDYAKCTKEFWDREMLILGPWPERGEYELCHVFEACSPENASIEKLIQWVELGRQTSFYDTQQWHKSDAEKERKDIGNQQDAMIRNWLPAFGAAPMSARGTVRSQKAMPITRTAEELGLPTQGGMRRTKNPQNAPKFEVPVTL